MKDYYEDIFAEDVPPQEMARVFICDMRASIDGDNWMHDGVTVALISAGQIYDFIKNHIDYNEELLKYWKEVQREILNYD